LTTKRPGQSGRKSVATGGFSFISQALVPPYYASCNRLHCSGIDALRRLRGAAADGRGGSGRGAAVRGPGAPPRPRAGDPAARGQRDALGCGRPTPRRLPPVPLPPAPVQGPRALLQRRAQPPPRRGLRHVPPRRRPRLPHAVQRARRRLQARAGAPAARRRGGPAIAAGGRRQGGPRAAHGFHPRRPQRQPRHARGRVLQLSGQGQRQEGRLLIITGTPPPLHHLSDDLLRPPKQQAPPQGNRRRRHARARLHVRLRRRDNQSARGGGGRRRERGERGEGGDGPGEQGRAASPPARAPQEPPVRAALHRLLPVHGDEGGGGRQGRRPARARAPGMRRRQGRRARARGPRLRRRGVGRRVREEEESWQSSLLPRRARSHGGGQLGVCGRKRARQVLAARVRRQPGVHQVQSRAAVPRGHLGAAPGRRAGRRRGFKPQHQR
jgi:hypothetical protein